MQPDAMQNREMLDQALTKATKLLATLQKQRADLLVNSATLSPEELAQGDAAIKNAIDAATRMIDSLDDAISGLSS